MPCNCLQQLCRSIIEYLNIPCFIRIACTLLIQHLDHHIVCGLIQERDHDILSIYLEISVCILFHGRFGNLPYKIPGQCFRQRVAQLFHIGFIHIAGFCGAHVRKCIIMIIKAAFLQELRNDLLFLHRIKPYLISPKSIGSICKQII